MSTWGYQEILTAGRCDKTFQPVVIVVYFVCFYQVQGGLVPAHGGEEVGGGHEDGDRFSS